MSQIISWLAPCSAGTVTRTVVHFFPSSGNVGAPYPAHCRLTLFGSGQQSKTVVIEGARLSQPDGLWLDDAFPDLKQKAGFQGVVIELSTPQPRVDITSSGCVVEFQSPKRLSRFWPLKLSKDGEIVRRGALPLLQDPFQSSSLLVVNGGQVPFKPSILSSRLLREKKALIEPLSVPTVEAFNVAEIPIPPTYFENVAPQECAFGLMRMASVEMTEPPAANCSTFILYRDASTSHPVSVCAL